MARKNKKIAVERLNEGSDTPTIVEFSDTEWALVNAYFDKNMNQTKAYLSVFKDAKYDSAKVEASKFFTKPNIRREIEYRLTQDAMSKSEVLKRIGDMARASLQPFIKIADDGFVYFDFSHEDALKNLHLIRKIKTKRERRVDGSGDSAEEWEGEWVEVELHNAADALRDIGRHHKMFTDKIESSGYVINFDWGELTADQIVRLRNGESPDVIERELKDKKK